MPYDFNVLELYTISVKENCIKMSRNLILTVKKLVYCDSQF